MYIHYSFEYSSVLWCRCECHNSSHWNWKYSYSLSSVSRAWIRNKQRHESHFHLHNIFIYGRIRRYHRWNRLLWYTCKNLIWHRRCLAGVRWAQFPRRNGGTPTFLATIYSREALLLVPLRTSPRAYAHELDESIFAALAYLLCSRHFSPSTDIG